MRGEGSSTYSAVGDGIAEGIVVGGGEAGDEGEGGGGVLHRVVGYGSKAKQLNEGTSRAITY